MSGVRVQALRAFLVHAFFAVALGVIAAACDRDVVVGYSDEAAVTPIEITWASGAHPGNDLEDYVGFAAWRGRPVDVAHVFTDRLGGWIDIVTPGWPVGMMAEFAGRLVISQPFYPEGEGNLTDCAAGLYDDQWRQFGTFLVERSRADSIVRLGWGFNDNDHEWVAGPTGADVAEWITCFRRVVTTIRATDPDVQIDWTFNRVGPPEVIAGDPYVGYPGDDVVDYVGLEVFDHYPATIDDASWDAACNGIGGLCGVWDFARAHGKQVGIAEWGIVTCGDSAGGDNPLFIQKVLETFATNSDVLAYEAYFEDGNLDVCSNLQDSDNTLAAARYEALYGM